MRAGRALQGVSGLLALVLGLSCAPRPRTEPGTPRPEPGTALVRVVEILDRRFGERVRDRGLADAAVVALSGQALPLPGYEQLLGGPGPLELVVGSGHREPAEGLVEELEARLGLLRTEPADSSRGPASVLVAAPSLEGGTYSGLCDLLRERPPGAPPALAFLDLTGPAEPGRHGWRWEARLVLAGTDPVAVDRVGLRILDSARRATAAPPLETVEGAGLESLARAESELGGTARLERIEWLKEPLTR